MDLHQRIYNRMLACDVRPQSTDNQYFVFELKSDNLHDTFQSWAFEKDVGVKPLISCIKGELKKAYIANLDSLSTIIEWLDASAKILLLGTCSPYSVREASVHYLVGGDKIGESGKLTPVSVRVAMNENTWLFDQYTGQYFTYSVAW